MHYADKAEFFYQITYHGVHVVHKCFPCVEVRYLQNRLLGRNKMTPKTKRFLSFQPFVATFVKET